MSPELAARRKALVARLEANRERIDALWRDMLATERQIDALEQRVRPTMSEPFRDLYDFMTKRPRPPLW